MRSLSVAVILTLIIATSGDQYSFWNGFNSAACYQFYGECLTKYSNRAARESNLCEGTRSSKIREVETTFNQTVVVLLKRIKVIQSNIACGSIDNQTQQQGCLSNVARNNIKMLKDIENESIQVYKNRSQQRSIANAIADVCFSDVNVKASEAIQEIDKILRSCYLTGKSVKPEHEWYSVETDLVSRAQQPEIPTTTSAVKTSNFTTPLLLESKPLNISDSLFDPTKEVEPAVIHAAGKIKQSVDGWFTNARNKVMSFIH